MNVIHGLLVAENSPQTPAPLGAKAPGLPLPVLSSVARRLAVGQALQNTMYDPPLIGGE